VSMEWAEIGSHSGRAKREPESRLDSRPGLSAGVMFFRGNDHSEEEDEEDNLPKIP
jgi:hypothetical protein